MRILNSSNPNVIMQYDLVIQTILHEIEARHISIDDFCNENNLDMDDFLDSLVNKRASFSYYLEILEALKKYKG